MQELLSSTFFINALLASFLISIVAGIIAPLMMINRLFSTAAALTHSAFGGVGLAFYFALPVFLCTSIFSMVLAFIMAFLSWEKNEDIDKLSGVLWSFGMALGAILLDLSPSYHPSISSYLFGNILAIAKADLLLMSVIALVFIVLILLFYTQFEIISFDKELAKLKGFKGFYYLLFLMLCLCISVSMKLLGLILMMALLSIPVLIAKSFSKNLLFLMINSALFIFIFCFLGLLISFYFNTLSAATIVMVALFTLLFFKLIRREE